METASELVLQSFNYSFRIPYNAHLLPSSLLCNQHSLVEDFDFRMFHIDKWPHSLWCSHDNFAILVFSNNTKAHSIIHLNNVKFYLYKTMQGLPFHLFFCSSLTHLIGLFIFPQHVTSSIKENNDRYITYV